MKLVSLHTASLFKLKMVNVFPADNASAAEESLHAALHGCRMEGEWFSLTNAQQEALLHVVSFAAGQFVVGGRQVSVEELLGKQ